MHGRLSDKSLDRELAALERFDVWNGRKDFSMFHIEWAMGFRVHTLEDGKGRDRQAVEQSPPPAQSWRRSVSSSLWLSQQDGFRSRIRASDADYFNLSRRDEAEARAAPPRPAPSVKQAKRALELMPCVHPARDAR